MMVASKKGLRASSMESANPEWEPIGQRMVVIRGSLSQPEMAALLNVSKTTYGRLERGVREVGADILKRFAEHGCNPLWLLTGYGSVRLPAGMSPAAVTDTALVISSHGLTPRARLEQGIARSAGDQISISQPLRQGTLTLSIELATEALDGAVLDPSTYAELVSLVYSALISGLSSAQVVAFARPAALGLQKTFHKGEASTDEQVR